MGPRAPLPPLALAAPATCVAAAAALANCALLAALLKLSKTGLYSIISQLAVVDFILITTTIMPEIWTYYLGFWGLGHECCVAYKGLSVLASTASMYLVIAVALHSLATVNLEEKALARKLKRMNRDDDEEMRSSRHSLVANSDTSTPPRTMNVEYRLSGARVPVGPPSVFVWLLATSLSVPQFILSTLVHEDQDTVQCGLADSSHRLNMHTLLVIFTLILPTTILFIAGIMTILKLKTINVSDIDCESVSALKFSILLTVVCCVMCVPRLVMDVYSFHNSDIKLGPLRLAFSCIYLVSTLIRPILSSFMLKPLRETFSLNCNANEENV